VKKFFPDKTQRIIVPFTQKFVIKLSKIWVWYPGSGKKLSRILGQKGHRIPDPQHCLFHRSNFALFRFCSRTARVCFCRGFSSCRRLFSRRRPPAPPPPPTWAGRLSYCPSRHAHSSTYQLESNPLRWSRVKLLEASIDPLSMNTPNPKCRLFLKIDL
jgi:hypothetical protein